MVIEASTQYASDAMSWWKRVMCGRLGWHWYGYVTGFAGPLEVRCIWCGNHAAAAGCVRGRLGIFGPIDLGNDLMGRVAEELARAYAERLQR